MIFEERPWGNYTVLYTDGFSQVKKIVIHPGKRISLQSHRFRAEHWFIVSGQGLAELDGETISLNPGDSVDISVGAKHRIASINNCELVFIEVQTGESFMEDDIVRFDDDFGRKS